MNITQVHEYFIKIILFFFILIIFFVYGIITAFNPSIGLLLVAALGFTILYYFFPPLFAYLYVFTVSFAAFLNLPVTAGGFSSAVAIGLSSFGLGVCSSLIKKDRHLIKIFVGRIDQILPILFFSAWIISMKNSRAINVSIKQLQQFFYLIVIYYFLNLTVRNRQILRTALFVLFAGGIIVGMLGMIEGITQIPTYFLLGSRSLLGAHISDAFLNVRMGRINGLIGDSPFHGIYMTMIALVSLYFFFTSERLILKIICPLVFLISGFNIMGTGSRGALMSLFFGLFLFWVLAEIPHKTVIMISILIASVIMVVIMVLFTPNINVSRSYTYSEETSSTAQMRWDNIPVSIRMFIDHPIFGTGPDGFVINYRRYAAGLVATTSREKTLRTHNTPLQVLVEYGLVGITLFILIIFMAIKRMIEVRRYSSDQKDRIIAVTLISVISSYIPFMLTSNSILDKYFWLVITMSQIHYSNCE